jgi:hypothetical protein
MNEPSAPPLRTCRVASTPEEVLEAWTLVHDVYLAKGHISPQPEGIYTTASALHPGTVVFNAYEDTRLVATLTAVPDSRFGLPPEEGFAAELQALRETADPLVFCGQFVSASPNPGDSPARCAQRFEQTFELLAMLASHARRWPQLRILANPIRRHVRYYERFLGFERLGPLRTYGGYHVESALMVTTWERLKAAPRLPVSLAEALAHPVPCMPGPRGITTSTLSLPQMQAFVEARWGRSAPLFALRSEVDPT